MDKVVNAFVFDDTNINWEEGCEDIFLKYIKTEMIDLCASRGYVSYHEILEAFGFENKKENFKYVWTDSKLLKEAIEIDHINDGTYVLISNVGIGIL